MGIPNYSNAYWSISMSIYRKNTYHRKIYEDHCGPIPYDSQGRSYEIHHIDGNHNNDDISNLLCVSIQEHYNIHYSQGDYKACLIMSNRMKISPEEKSRLAKISNAGKNNPMYGTIWITNGSENKKIKKDSEIPNGWKKGRYFNEDLQKTFVSRSKIGKNNSRYDPTLYCFYNIVSSEKVTMSCWDFCTKYNLRRKPIRAVAKGQRTEYKGWQLF